MDKRLYDTFAEVEETHWWFVGRRDVIRAVFRRFSTLVSRSRDLEILDIGCGTGGMLSLLSEFGRTEGFDSEPDAVEYCKLRYGAEVDVRVGTLPDSLEQEPPKDIITAFDVIEHVDDDARVLRGVAATLREEGIFVCTVPAYMWLWSHHDDLNRHRRRYTRTELRTRLDAAGLTVLYTSYFNTVLLPAIAVVRFIQRVLPSSKKTDFERSPSVLNPLLRLVLSFEAFLLRFVALPGGVSLIAVAQKKEIAR